MQKVIGVGETVYDIVFKNAMITLGRLGVPAHFISEVGNDSVGKNIVAFMQENGLDTKSVDMFSDGQTALSLAFLNENNDAQYTLDSLPPDLDY